MRKLIFPFVLLLAVFSVIPLSAQTTFRYSYDVGAFDISGGMIETPTGDFVIAGLNNSFGPYYGNAVKIDNAGNVLWAKAYTAGFASSFNDIKNVSTGGYIMTGQSTSGGGGAILVRIDASGNLLWAKRYQLPDRPADDASSEYGNAVIETSDGGFLVGGGVDYFWDGVSGNTVDTASAMGFKVDVNGNLLWSKVWTITTTNPDEHYINDVAESADGYFFVGQSSEGSGTLSSNGDYPSNSLVIKTTTAGALTYIRRWGAGNTSSQGINSALTLTTGANAGRVLLGGFDDVHAFLTTIDGTGSTPTMGAFNRRINGATFPPRTLLIQDIMENSDGNYSVIGMQLEPLSLAFYTAILKINSSSGALIFGRGYTPIGLSSILPEGGLCSDQGYYVSMTDQQTGGFNYNVIRTNNVGQLGAGVAGCNSTNLTPGTAAYSVTLSTPTSANFDLMSASVFTPTVTNMTPTNTQHCQNIACTPPIAPTTVTASPNPICAGQSTTITASGSGSGVVYNVFTTATGGTSIGTTPLVVTPGSTITYYVETAISGQPSCLSTSRTPVTVTVNNLPVVSPANNGPLCAGQTLNLSSSGGTTYSWTGPNSFTSSSQNPSITGATTAASGIYSVTVTDANSCSVTATTTVSVVANPTVSLASQTNVACNGASTGAATVTATGGNGSFTYAWAPSGGSAATASGLAQGTYTCTVTSGGCVSTQTVSITQPSAITTTTASTAAACGSNTGSATVTPSGGAGGYTYSWAPSGGTGATASALAGGITYTCTVVDANTCSVTATVAVTSAAGPTVTVSSQNDVSCNGGTDGSATASTSGGSGVYTYTWSPSGGNAATANGLAAGNYTVTASDGSCLSTQAVVITEPAAISSTTSSTVTNCGASTGSASVSVTGGTGAYTYSWSPSGGTAATATNLGSGTYTCLVQDANTCTYTVSVVVNSASGPLVSLATQTNVACFGGSTGAATVSASGGTGTLSYNWLPAGGTSASASGLSAGIYTCVVTDAANCVQSQTVSITEPPVISTTTTTTTSACAASTGSAAVSASGGSGSYTYTWLPGGQTTATATGLAAGVYTVAVMDGNSCTVFDSVTVSNPNPPTITASGNGPLCEGTAINLNSGGGVTYSWVGPNAFTSSSQNPSISASTTAASGTYTVTGTDASGCVNTATVNIVVNATPVPTASAGTATVCSGSSINLSASGGTTYTWSGPASYTSTVQNPVISNAQTTASGVYTVTASNGSCSATATVSVLVNPSPTAVAAGGGSVCSGNSINLSSSGGGTYAWSGPGSFTSSQQNPVISNATSANTGIYTVVVTNSLNCTATATVQVNVGSSSTSAVSAAVCQGQNYTLPGGSQVSATGIYVDTLQNVNGCDSIVTTTLTVNTNPTVTIAVAADTIIEGQSTVLTASGAATYVWNPAGSNNTYTFTSNTSGDYTVCVVGSNGSGCADTACETIYVKKLDCGEVYVPNAFSPNNDNVNDLLCIYGNQCIKEMEFRIYDRWGELVYESSDPSACWDGMYKGEKLNAALFAYYLKATLSSGDEVSMHGNISLVK